MNMASHRHPGSHMSQVHHLTLCISVDGIQVSIESEDRKELAKHLRRFIAHFSEHPEQLDCLAGYYKEPARF